VEVTVLMLVEVATLVLSTIWTDVTVFVAYNVCVEVDVRSVVTVAVF
jgi:hypothetical protein